MDPCENSSGNYDSDDGYETAPEFGDGGNESEYGSYETDDNESEYSLEADAQEVDVNSSSSDEQNASLYGSSDSMGEDLQDIAQEVDVNSSSSGEQNASLDGSRDSKDCSQGMMGRMGNKYSSNENTSEQQQSKPTKEQDQKVEKGSALKLTENSNDSVFKTVIMMPVWYVNLLLNGIRIIGAAFAEVLKMLIGAVSFCLLESVRLLALISIKIGAFMIDCAVGCFYVLRGVMRAPRYCGVKFIEFYASGINGFLSFLAKVARFFEGGRYEKSTMKSFSGCVLASDLNTEMPVQSVRQACNGRVNGMEEAHDHQIAP